MSRIWGGHPRPNPGSNRGVGRGRRTSIAVTSQKHQGAQGDIVNCHHRMGGIGRHSKTAYFAWNAFAIHNVPLGLPGLPGHGYPTQCAANTCCPRSDRFWLLELRVSRHFSTFYGPSVQTMDTQLSATSTADPPTIYQGSAQRTISAGSLVVA